jgi:hypothetical protein
MTNVQGLSVIGYFVWWSVHNQRIRRDVMQALIDNAGIRNKHGSKFEVPEIKPRSAFLKAVREVRGQQKNKGILIRKIRKDAISYLFGLVDERVDENAKELHYAQNATMTFNPINGNLSTDRPHRAFTLVKELYEEYKDYLNSDDVRALVLDIIAELPTVSVRQRGGIYFIPVKYEDMVNKLEFLLASLPGTNGSAGDGSYLSIAPQIDTEKSKKSIYKAFVVSLKNKLKGFTHALEDQEISTPHALKNKLHEFKEMRAEIEFYKDALQFQVDDLRDSLTVLTNKVKNKLLKA